MRSLNYKVAVLIACFAFLINSCSKDNVYETGVPGNDNIRYLVFELQDIDSVRYWGDSEKIWLQSAMIKLNPDNHTYFKRFNGTADEALDPAQSKWSKEESGKYSFSSDSSYITLGTDKDIAFYSPGYWSNGTYYQSTLSQYDSVWYSILYYSMAVSGRFKYTLKPDQEGY